MNATDARYEPIDVVRQRLNDPDVAAAVLRVLDNAELLSVLTSGLNEFFARGDTIIESLAGSVRELKDAAPANGSASKLASSASDFITLANNLAAVTPVINQALESGMLEPKVIDLLGTLSASATEGAANAAANKTTVQGVRATLKALKDPDVARGLGLVIEIAKSLGRRLAAQ